MPPAQGESTVGPPGDRDRPDSAMLDMDSMRAVVFRRPGVLLHRGESCSLQPSRVPGDRLPSNEWPADCMESVRAALSPGGGESEPRPPGEPSTETRARSGCEEERRASTRNSRLMGTAGVASCTRGRRQHMSEARTQTRMLCTAAAAASHGTKPVLPCCGCVPNNPHQSNKFVVVVVVVVVVIVLVAVLVVVLAVLVVVIVAVVVVVTEVEVRVPVDVRVVVVAVLVVVVVKVAVVVVCVVVVVGGA